MVDIDPKVYKLPGITTFNQHFWVNNNLPSICIVHSYKLANCFDFSLNKTSVNQNQIAIQEQLNTTIYWKNNSECNHLNIINLFSIEMSQVILWDMG